MEPSPSRSSMSSLPPFGIPYTPSTTVDLRRLTGPPEGIIPFTMTRSRRGTLGMSQQEASSVPTTEGERGHWRWTYWSSARLISRLVTGWEPSTPGQIHHHQHQTLETLTLTGQALIRSQGSPHWKSGHLSGDPVTPLNPNPIGCQPPERCHRCTSFGLNSAMSLVPLVQLGDGRGGGRKAADRSTKRRGWWRWWVGVKGVPRPDGDRVIWRSTRSRGEDDEEGETEDQLGHPRKHGGEHRRARVRIQNLTGTRKKMT
jgi:hypothetical protein